MTAESITTQQIFKEQYVDNPEMNQVPMGLWFMREVPFDSRNREGGNYRYPAILRMPQGATYNGGATLGTNFTLNGAIPGQTLQAFLQGCEYVFQEEVPYGFVSKSQDSKQAFEPGMDLLVRMVVAKTAFDLEIMCLYGGGSIGACSVKGALAGLVATITISTATWAVGLWAAREGGQLDAYDPTLVTKRNTTGAITCGVVDFVAHTISMTFAAIGDHTALTVGDVFVPLGANGNWADGIDTIITESAAGTATVLGIPTATYGLWRSNTYAAGGALTFGILASAAAAAANKGGMQTELTALVSNWAWTDINNAQAALRMYTEQYGGKFENGATELVYFGPNGKITIVPHACVKAGEAFLLDKPMLRRMGSSEPTFGLKGIDQDKFLMQVANKASFEFRRWADMGLASFRLCTHTKITGITNTTTP
jgi:hypothetical protein